MASALAPWNVQHAAIIISLTAISLPTFMAGMGGLLTHGYFQEFAATNLGWFLANFYQTLAWSFTTIAELSLPGLWFLMIAGVYLFTIPLREFLSPGSSRELMSWVRRDVNLSRKYDLSDMMSEISPSIRRYNINRHQGLSTWDALFVGATNRDGVHHPAAITAETVKNATNIIVWILSFLEIFKLLMERMAELADDALLGGAHEVDPSEIPATFFKTGVHYFFIFLEGPFKLLQPIFDLPYYAVRFVVGVALVIAGALTELASLISAGIMMTVGVLLSTGPQGVMKGLKHQWDNSLSLTKSYATRLYDALFPIPEFDPTHDTYTGYTPLNCFTIGTDSVRTRDHQPSKGDKLIAQPWFIRFNPHYKPLFEESQPSTQFRYARL